MKLPEKLRLLRVNNGLSLATLSSEFLRLYDKKVWTTYISHWETGTRIPKNEILELYERYFKVDLSEFKNSNKGDWKKFKESSMNLNKSDNAQFLINSGLEMIKNHFEDTELIVDTIRLGLEIISKEEELI